MEELEAVQTMPEYQTDPGLMIIPTILWLAVLIFMLVSMWKIFTKAGRPGWASLIPLYNLYVFLQIVGRPGWWLVLYLIPFVNIVISVVNAIDLAKVFGKSSVFGVIGLWLFSLVGYPILAFGKSTYKAPTTTAVPANATPTTPQTPPAKA